MRSSSDLPCPLPSAPPFFFPPSTQPLFGGSIGIVIPLSDFFKDTRFVPSASGLRWFNIKNLALYDVKVCLGNSNSFSVFSVLWAISWCKEFLGVNVGVCLMLRGCGDTGGGPLCAVRCARVLCCFSRVWFFATLWTVACQAPLSMGFSRQEYWSGLPCPPPQDLSNPGIKPASLTSPVLAGRFFTTCTTWKVHTSRYDSCKPFSFSSLPSLLDCYDYTCFKGKVNLGLEKLILCWLGVPEQSWQSSENKELVTLIEETNRLIRESFRSLVSICERKRGRKGDLGAWKPQTTVHIW